LVRKNIADWRLGGRVRVENADIRRYRAENGVDLVTFYNLIYYFPLAERVHVLRMLAGNLRPGGRLLVTTLCRMNTPSIESMNLWSTMTEGCGPLPGKDEIIGMLRDAGFVDVKSRRLIPGFYLYDATNA